jgi:DNA-binding HxlR family transcriptional regulator
MTTRYLHFCPAARALEKVGDKWSLLIVRDLLQGTQRFTDLLAYLNNITPKWLTLRLRELETAGIVERDYRPGRREVWYRLTNAGSDLSPVIEALVTWGLRYAMRPPLPGEVINIDKMMKGLAKSLNKRGKRLSHPATCSIKFPEGAYLLSFNKDEWASSPGEKPDADIKIDTTPEIMAAFFTAPREDRKRIFKSMHVVGKSNRINDFLLIFGILKAERKMKHKGR